MRLFAPCPPCTKFQLMCCKSPSPLEAGAGAYALRHPPWWLAKEMEIECSRPLLSSQISHEGKTFALGDYETEAQAAQAFDRALVSKFGRQAKTNFPVENYFAEADSLQGVPNSIAVFSVPAVCITPQPPCCMMHQHICAKQHPGGLPPKALLLEGCALHWGS